MVTHTPLCQRVYIPREYSAWNVTIPRIWNTICVQTGGKCISEQVAESHRIKLYLNVCRREAKRETVGYERQGFFLPFHSILCCSIPLDKSDILSESNMFMHNQPKSIAWFLLFRKHHQLVYTYSANTNRCGFKNTLSPPATRHPKNSLIPP